MLNSPAIEPPRSGRVQTRRFTELRSTQRCVFGAVVSVRLYLSVDVSPVEIDAINPVLRAKANLKREPPLKYFSEDTTTPPRRSRLIGPLGFLKLPILTSRLVAFALLTLVLTFRQSPTERHRFNVNRRRGDVASTSVIRLSPNVRTGNFRTPTETIAFRRAQ